MNRGTVQATSGTQPAAGYDPALSADGRTLAWWHGAVRSQRGELSRAGMAQRVADATRRGALTRGSQDFLEYHWFDVADRPVEVLRAELALPPKDPGAVAAGSRGPWERGGLSPFQRQSGEALAVAEGRDYRELHAPDVS